MYRFRIRGELVIYTLKAVVYGLYGMTLSETSQHAQSPFTREHLINLVFKIKFGISQKSFQADDGTRGVNFAVFTSLFSTSFL